MGETKQINIKNRTCYFYNNIIDLKNFNAKLLKIDKKSYKDLDIYYIGYITIKKKIICICVLIMQGDILKKTMEINT